ncbi:hypothetical protein PQ469_03945 [Mucilaginibacter sp. KACC 22773]|uniref:acylneuraminate cytidylyltransferase family protein n=1 Tax=Mucilaginibacter sp. KACC 22773 TaxID=3025671 RepID=UPI002366A5E7|nr:hypothetical protein [Mucilaginibacter sp. KACC 22773]WDF79153.1 hypothetical protein PQ469_03945 [Mucilaginibacter sp. KACC 22773]
MKYVVEIPVRLGSKRVPKKNLRLINGKPMVAYAIEAAKASKFVDKVYVNSEAEVIRKLCADYGVEFYERKPELAEDTATQDEFNYDFLCNVEAENLVLVNPVSPLVLPEDIDNVIRYYEEHKLDSLISVKEEKLQTFFADKPLNFRTDGPLPMTQSLVPIQLCAWTVCIWNAKKFKEHYEKHNYAVFVGNYGLYPFDPIRSIKVSSEEDFILAELYLKSKLSDKSKEIAYYE